MGDRARVRWITMGMRFVRYGIPAILVVAGFVVLLVVDDTTKWEG
jgi:hypothetical protein